MTTESGAPSNRSPRRNTRTTGAKKAAGAGTASPAANAGAANKAAQAAGVELAQALKDAAHAVIGFGVIGWNKAQVQRRELLKDLNGQRHTVETQLDGAKEQLATAIRHFDARIEPVRHDLDVQLDKATERLPEQVRDLVQSARKIARDTERQVRQAVGAL
jgi:predicted component of type VI protein secretion system